MRKLNEVKYGNNVLLELLFEKDVLDEEIIDLQRSYNLTEKQAQRTIDLFPELEEAEKVADYYFSIKDPGQRKLTFGNYDNFLNRLEDIVYAKRGIYEEEVENKTKMVSNEMLLRYSYRDKPHRARDFWEHLQTTALDNLRQ